jgi:hypothetical protein
MILPHNNISGVQILKQLIPNIFGLKKKIRIVFCFMVPCRLVDGFEEMSPSTLTAARPKFREGTERQQKTKLSFIRFSVLK